MLSLASCLPSLCFFSDPLGYTRPFSNRFIYMAHFIYLGYYQVWGIHVLCLSASLLLSLKNFFSSMTGCQPSLPRGFTACTLFFFFAGYMFNSVLQLIFPSLVFLDFVCLESGWLDINFWGGGRSAISLHVTYLALPYLTYIILYI